MFIELFCLESHILSFPIVLQIPPESYTVYIYYIDVTFSKFFTSFLQLYMFRAFLAHLQELFCCAGSCRFDEL
jgi:hypothetical protein